MCSWARSFCLKYSLNLKTLGNVLVICVCVFSINTFQNEAISTTRPSPVVCEKESRIQEFCAQRSYKMFAFR